MWQNEALIYSYSRTQAINDGILFDVSKMANEIGIKYPVAITNSVQVICDMPIVCQDFEGRLWDILWIFRVLARNCGIQENELKYRVSIVMLDNKAHDVEFKAMVHGGDAGEPVITISLPNES